MKSFVKYKNQVESRGMYNVLKSALSNNIHDDAEDDDDGALNKSGTLFLVVSFSP